MNKIEFIARARFLAWCCYQIAADQSYNLEPTKDQLESLMNGVKYLLEHPNSTPEENHNNWMKCKIEQGWVYGKEKDLEKKTHFDLVPFDELIKVEKDKDIMDCLMNREFNKLWETAFEKKNKQLLIDFLKYIEDGSVNPILIEKEKFVDIYINTK